ncbi:MAG: hypothetical protein FGM33_04195 [Candidatus Kapabacteria bacterium]|nr:hypothetical protein [Candidatus Kapabacteria bacterium]
MKSKASLSSALVIILLSSCVCLVLTILAAYITGELLFLLAGALFAISGGAGVWVVRRLQRTIGGS